MHAACFLMRVFFTWGASSPASLALVQWKSCHPLSTASAYSHTWAILHASSSSGQPGVPVHPHYLLHGTFSVSCFAIYTTSLQAPVMLPVVCCSCRHTARQTQHRDSIPPSPCLALPGHWTFALQYSNSKETVTRPLPPSTTWSAGSVFSHLVQQQNRVQSNQNETCLEQIQSGSESICGLHKFTCLCVHAGTCVTNISITMQVLTQIWVALG